MENLSERLRKIWRRTRRRTGRHHHHHRSGSVEATDRERERGSTIVSSAKIYYNNDAGRPLFRWPRHNIFRVAWPANAVRAGDRGNCGAERERRMCLVECYSQLKVYK